MNNEDKIYTPLQLTDKILFIGSDVMLRRIPLAHYRCEGPWYDGVVCEIVRMTEKAILFKVIKDCSDYNVDEPFWIPISVLRRKASDKLVIHIKHWIDLQIYHHSEFQNL